MGARIVDPDIVAVLADEARFALLSGGRDRSLWAIRNRLR